MCVQARQYIWRYTYGNGCKNDSFTQKLPYSFTTMVVPVHTTVVLTIQSTDVIHSWWVPSLGGKVDAVPGYTTYTWFKAPTTPASSTASARNCAAPTTQRCWRSSGSSRRSSTRTGSPSRAADITSQNNQVQ